MSAGNFCNGELVRQLRSSLQWTQEDLAERTDLSVRSIAKVESAREFVSTKTVEAVVKAFNDAGQRVSPADFWCDPVALTRAFLHNYATHQAVCVEKSRSFISREIIAVIDGDPATNPLAGTYEGIDEFDGLWRKFFAIFRRDKGTLGDSTQIQAAGLDVFAWGHEWIHVPEAPPVTPGFVMLRIRFERGMMVRFEDYYETTGMMAGVAPWLKKLPGAAWAKYFHELFDAKKVVPLR